MKKKKSSNWQMSLFLVLVIALLLIIFLRVEQIVEAKPQETLPPEQMEIHEPVPETLPVRESTGARLDVEIMPIDDPGAVYRDANGPEVTLEPTPEPTPEPAPLLASVPLDAETQQAIYELCGNDDSLFCAVMAIAKSESEFTPNAVGDKGKCFGMMQINYAFHTERINRLEVSDLLDPVQCAAVAIDYIKDLSSEFNVGTDSHVLYMAYNMGPTGAREVFAKGIYSSSYTWKVAGLYEIYMAELERAEV